VSFFSVPKDEKWRNQQVHIEVRVPKGKTVFITKNMKRIMYNVRNETDTWDGDMVNRRWIMGEEELRCLDCEGLTEKASRKNKDEKIKISPDGINIKSKDGSIKIGSEGINIEDSDDSIEISKNGIKKY